MIRAPAVYLHDGHGVRIGQLSTVSGVRRSNAIDNNGRAQFKVGYDDPLIEQLTPRKGLSVYIVGDDYAPPWVGRVTKAAGRTSDRQVTVQALEWSRVLDHRVVNSTFSAKGSAGVAIRKLLMALRSAVDVPVFIDEGAIDSGAGGLDFSFSGDTARDVMNRVCEAGGLEWWVEPSLLSASSQLRYTLHAVQFRGDKLYGNVLLTEGGPCELTKWTEDGEAAAFDLSVIGGPQSPTEPVNTRPSARRTSRSVEPVRPHGFEVDDAGTPSTPLNAQSRIEYSDHLVSEGAVEAAAVARMARMAGSVRRTVAVEVTDPAMWNDCRVGNVVRLVSHSAFVTGWKGAVRVSAVQVAEESGSLGVAVQLLQEDD